MTSAHHRRLGLLSVGLPYFDVATANRHLAATRALLAPHYGLVGPDEIVTDLSALDAALDEFQAAPIGALLLQIGTFPDGEAPARLADRIHVPIVVHALPEPRLEREIALNSLCGANMAAFTLTALDKPYLFCFGDPQDPAAQRELRARLNAATSLSGLWGSRIGLIGFRAPGFYPCAFDELLLRRTLGVAIDHIALSELAREMDRGERRKAPRDRFPLMEGGDPARPDPFGQNLPGEAVERMERYFAALTNVVRASGHRVFAIKDWPEFFEAETEGGFWPALGWLQEDGIVLAPEGDVHAAVTMALQQNLTGGTPALVDIGAWDDGDSTLLLWHYAGAESLARDQAEIRFDRFGREVEFTLKPGPATLARIGLYRGQLRLLTVAVEMLDRRLTLRRAAGLARTIHTPANQVVQRLIGEGWEHHPCLVYGDLSVEFAGVARLAGLAHTAL
jgi:L-fucose isomerase-like protein